MLDTHKVKTATPFLQRLRADQTGNTLVMGAVALFPIIGLIGGGVDIGRGYMAKARLQQACDAGALAGRRSMTGETVSSTDQVQARKMFDFNFPEGSFGTESFKQVDGKANPLFTNGADEKTVKGTAQTTIPTTLMKVFGQKTMDIKVSCTSRLDVGNVDIMMVLDVTGSMDSSVSDGGTRISALKDSVEDFYNTLGGGGGVAGNQVRYGFVPYSSAVNVGNLLYNADSNWIAGGNAGETWAYQSRQAVYEIPGPDPVSEFFETVNDASNNFYTTSSECNRFGSNRDVYRWKKSGSSYSWSHSYTWWPSDDGYSGTGQNVTKSGDPDATYSFSDATFVRISSGSSYGTCTRKVTRTGESVAGEETYDGTEPGAVFKRWEYKQMNHDVHDYVQSINSGTGTQNPTTTSTSTNVWDGCIEERQSNNTITSATTTIPDDALDLQIDLKPTDAASRWGPFWKQVMYDRNSLTDGWAISTSGDSAICPPAARRLATYTSYDDGTSDDLQSYISGLTANGFTNHTIGMIWGARLLSKDGLFSATNANKASISRHILFMTDGNMVIRSTNYDSYGYGKLDNRLAPAGSSSSELQSRQSARFQLMCQAAKAKGWTVWVVQFGASDTDGDGTPDVSPNMLSCASSPSTAATASDKATLRAAFSNIAKTIGGLRLSE